MKYTDEQLIEIERNTTADQRDNAAVVLPLIADLMDARKKYRTCREISSEILDTLYGITKERKLGLGGEDLDRLVKEHVDALHAERDALLADKQRLVEAAKLAEDAIAGDPDEFLAALIAISRMKSIV